MTNLWGIFLSSYDLSKIGSLVRFFLLFMSRSSFSAWNEWMRLISTTYGRRINAERYHPSAFFFSPKHLTTKRRATWVCRGVAWPVIGAVTPTHLSRTHVPPRSRWSGAVTSIASAPAASHAPWRFNCRFVERRWNCWRLDAANNEYQSNRGSSAVYRGRKEGEEAGATVRVPLRQHRSTPAASAKGQRCQCSTMR